MWRFIGLILLQILLFSSISKSQDIVELIRFDSATLSEENGERVQTLTNPRMRMRNVTMVCDIAYRFLDRNEMHAFGNIQIDTDTENIWADTLYYYTNQELSELRGRVIIKQDSTTLFGEKVDYNFLTKVAIFPAGIRLEDNQGTLLAKQGTYFQNQDSAVFRFDVQLQDSAQYAEGDSLFINREREYFQLFSNVFVVDSTNDALLTGNYLEADSTGRRYVRDNAYLMDVSDDSSKADTTHIFAGEILLIEQDSTSTIDALDSVKVWTPRFSSSSDTLFYDSASELFTLTGTPIAWNKNIQLTGPVIRVQLDSSQVRELQAFTGAFAVQQDSVTLRHHQLKGDTLQAFFEDGDISRIELYPNSELLYHTTDDNGEPDGAMENSSPTTTLFFENGELVRAKMGQNQGLFLPEYDGLDNRYLDGYSWRPELRPQKPESIPKARFSAIPIERPFTLPERFLEFIASMLSD
ncbi:MAG: hypothetical protein JJ966_02495 [Balneolaceae bacterium]|nr:hypothetical protein [Balneolaceae bacterium]